MILAAGFGTRLRPLTEQTPKPLLPVGGRPIVEHNLLLLKKHGIAEVVINLHYLGEKIVGALGDGGRLGMNIVYSHEAETLGTGGGIRQAAPHLRDGTFVVINGDILTDLDLGSAIDFHRQKGGIATLVLREEEAEAFGPLEIDPSDRIRTILGQPAPTGPLRPNREPLRKRMFTGVHVIEPQLLAEIQAGPSVSIIDTYIDLIRRGLPLWGFTMRGYWNDIGTPERYRQAERDLAEGRCHHLMP